MKKSDYSKKIYDKYYNSESRILQIFLKDGSVLEGIFVGFFHGDQEAGEPFIINWHFIDKDEISDYNTSSSIEGISEFGSIIHQKDIKSVKFKP